MPVNMMLELLTFLEFFAIRFSMLMPKVMFDPLGPESGIWHQLKPILAKWTLQ